MEACSNLYKKKPKNIAAVTGTNGKSSVADFFYQILKLNKKKVSSIGTLGIRSKNYSRKTNLTSMDPLFLHKNLEILAKKRIDNVILEASSHGLKQRRLNNLNIKTGIFTNLSHDHLDYHKNMKSYLESKLYLFKELLNKKSTIVTDEENKEFQKIKNIAKKRKIKPITIGKNFGTIKIISNKYDGAEQIVKISVNSKIFTLKLSLIGFFQIKNLLLACLAASSFGISIKKIFKKLHKIKTVPGRLESVVSLKNNSYIIVDFAHTPHALEQALIAIKKQFKKEIILVFGCGGDRDKLKRYKMGLIAKKYCKKIYVTDDNPRNENPEKIRKKIISGCKKLAVNIGNRKKAIETAISNLKSNEILLVAGKGHEENQNYGNKILKFSDKKVIKQIVKKKKFNLKKISWTEQILTKVFDKNDIKNIKYSGVSINSKTTKKNNLFFAIKGRKKDGHNFVKEAIKNGAIKSIISKKIKNIPTNKIIKVKDTFNSFNNFSKEIRDFSKAKIIGITGSTGKTTLKNLTSFALKNYGNVHYSPHSYNNKFGVPLSLSNLNEKTKYGVFEIGMDKKGEIHNLSNIIKPNTGVITNISEAHIKNFNNLKDIAKAKAEIIDNIVDNGNIILNKDSKFFNFLFNKARKKKLNIITFSTKKKADVFLFDAKKIKNNYKIKVIIKDKTYNFYTKYSTDNFIQNLLACISILLTFNLNLKKIEKKFTKFSIPSGRGDIKIVKKFGKKFKFIDESYNANPLSMKSAIANMNLYKRKNREKKIIFLGDMLELGKKSQRLHNSLIKIINKTDIDKVFVYGKHIKKIFNYLLDDKKGKIFNNFNEAYAHLSKIIRNNDLLMIKGSNATGLNRFAKNIKKRQINAI